MTPGCDFAGVPAPPGPARSRLRCSPWCDRAPVREQAIGPCVRPPMTLTFAPCLPPECGCRTSGRFHAGGNAADDRLIGCPCSMPWREKDPGRTRAPLRCLSSRIGTLRREPGMQYMDRNAMEPIMPKIPHERAMPVIRDR